MPSYFKHDLEAGRWRSNFEFVHLIYCILADFLPDAGPSNDPTQVGYSVNSTSIPIPAIDDGVNIVDNLAISMIGVC